MAQEEKKRDKRFQFTHAFSSINSGDDQFSSQKKIFSSVGKPLSKDFMKGVNVSLLFYGGTNSGKTYTMSGTKEEPGLFRLISKYICDKMEDEDDAFVEISMFEIYKEEINDLLNPLGPKSKKNVFIREHDYFGPTVCGLSTTGVGSFDEVEKLIQHEYKFRTLFEAEYGKDYCESHLVYRIKLTQEKTVSLFHFVEIASAEFISNKDEGWCRIDKTSSNQSLNTFGDVVEHLGVSRGAATNTLMYKDSTLTWLLKDSLVGHEVRTVFFATLSPHVDDYEETKAVLAMAQHAFNIKRTKKPKIARKVDEEKILKRIRAHHRKIEKNLEEMRDGSEKLKLKMSQQQTKELIDWLTEVVYEDEDEDEDDEDDDDKYMKLRKKFLKSIGFFGQQGRQNVKKTPYLSNMCADPTRRHLLKMFLLPKKTLLVSSESKPRKGSKKKDDITSDYHFQLKGHGMMKNHALFKHEVGKKKKSIITINVPGDVDEDDDDRPILLVNGELVTEEQELECGDRISFGESGNFVYLYIDPSVPPRDDDDDDDENPDGRDMTFGEMRDEILNFRKEKMPEKLERHKKNLFREHKKRVMELEERERGLCVELVELKTDATAGFNRSLRSAAQFLGNAQHEKVCEAQIDALRVLRKARNDLQSLREQSETRKVEESKLLGEIDKLEEEKKAKEQDLTGDEVSMGDLDDDDDDPDIREMMAELMKEKMELKNTLGSSVDHIEEQMNDLRDKLANLRKIELQIKVQESKVHQIQSNPVISISEITKKMRGIYEEIMATEESMDSTMVDIKELEDENKRGVDEDENPLEEEEIERNKQEIESMYGENEELHDEIRVKWNAVVEYQRTFVEKTRKEAKRKRKGKDLSRVRMELELRKKWLDNNNEENEDEEENEEADNEELMDDLVRLIMDVEDANHICKQLKKHYKYSVRVLIRSKTYFSVVEEDLDEQKRKMEEYEKALALQKKKKKEEKKRLKKEREKKLKQEEEDQENSENDSEEEEEDSDDSDEKKKKTKKIKLTSRARQESSQRKKKEKEEKLEEPKNIVHLLDLNQFSKRLYSLRRYYYEGGIFRKNELYQPFKDLSSFIGTACIPLRHLVQTNGVRRMYDETITLNTIGGGERGKITIGMESTFQLSNEETKLLEDEVDQTLESDFDGGKPGTGKKKVKKKEKRTSVLIGKSMDVKIYITQITNLTPAIVKDFSVRFQFYNSGLEETKHHSTTNGRLNLNFMMVFHIPNLTAKMYSYLFEKELVFAVVGDQYIEKSKISRGTRGEGLPMFNFKKFSITVIEAEHLKKKKGGGLLSRKKNVYNPYVKIRYPGGKVKTEIIYNQNNPQWMEEVNIDCEDHDYDSELEILIMHDEKMARNKPFGEVTINYAQAYRTQSESTYFKLVNKDGGHAGRLKMSFRFE